MVGSLKLSPLSLWRSFCDFLSKFEAIIISACLAQKCTLCPLELLWRWWFSVIDPLRALHISLHWRNILHQSDKNMKRFKSTFTMQPIFRKCEHHYSLQFQPNIKCSPLLCSKKRLSGNIVSLSWASTCSADLMSFYRGDKRACWCWLKASREVFARFWAVWNVWNQFTRTFTLSLGRLSLGLIHKPHKLVGDGET